MIGNERVRAGRGALGLTLCILAACADASPTPGVPNGSSRMGPNGGTETGNPPVIDAQRIALVVSPDGLRVVGSAGAITPGGVVIEIVALSTGRTFTTSSAADGSFDVTVEGPLAETFAVYARDGSGAVYVLRGSASVTVGDDGALSCDARSNLATTQMIGARSVADKTCVDDGDCITVSLGTACSQGCNAAYVSQSGARTLGDARDVIESGLCAAFDDAGCTWFEPPCLPQAGVPRCVEKQCMLVADGVTRDCTSDFDPGSSSASTIDLVYWFNDEARACEGRYYEGGGGNGNRYATSAECIAACAPGSDPGCPPTTVWASKCVQGGIAGGCGAYEMTCALRCTGSDQCAVSGPGELCNAQGFCEAFGI